MIPGLPRSPNRPAHRSAWASQERQDEPALPQGGGLYPELALVMVGLLTAEGIGKMDEIISTPSVVRPPEIRSRLDQGLGMALFEAVHDAGHITTRS